MDDPILARWGIVPAERVTADRLGMLGMLLERLKTSGPRNGNWPQDERPVHCQKCSDRGYYQPEGMTAYVRCECTEERRRERNVARLWRESGIPTKLKQASVDGMDLSHADTRTMVYAANEYLSEFEPPFLAFLGDNGNGKTRVAAAIARDAIEREIETMWVYSPVFVRHLQWGQFTGNPSGEVYHSLMERASTVPLLVVDDFGLYRETEWTDLQMDAIIGARYAEEKPTVLTSNVRLADMPGRLRSRLSDGEVCRLVPIEAPDYRARKG